MHDMRYTYIIFVRISERERRKENMKMDLKNIELDGTN
jgi:hypothetical protein